MKVEDRYGDKYTSKDFEKFCRDIGIEQ